MIKGVPSVIVDFVIDVVLFANAAVAVLALVHQGRYLDGTLGLVGASLFSLGYGYFTYRYWPSVMESHIEQYRAWAKSREAADKYESDQASRTRGAVIFGFAMALVFTILNAYGLAKDWMSAS